MSGEERDRPELQDDVVEGVSLQQDPADDAQKVRERQKFADRLRPARHAAEREHEAGEQDRRQEEEEGHLHGLQLVLGEGGKGDAHGEIGRDEDERDREQERMLPTIGTWKRKWAATRMTPTWM